MSKYHVPVLLKETLDALSVRPDGIYVDGTAGGGGHSAAILSKLGEAGRLIAADRDPDAIREVTARFKDDGRVTIVRSNYSLIPDVLTRLGIEYADGVLLDIGVSSHQFDCAERGFSYHSDAPLDMRMSGEGRSAADLVAELDRGSLAKIFAEYGEERFAGKIASAICREREDEPIVTTGRLAGIISSCYPAAARRDGHPARKVFQALRIAVNDELGELERGLASIFPRIAPGGVFAVITFHSLEDRLVKRTMAEWCRGCVCPPEFPVCVCGGKPKAELVLKHPASAGEDELEANPRSRSARLRACRRL